MRHCFFAVLVLSLFCSFSTFASAQSCFQFRNPTRNHVTVFLRKSPLGRKIEYLPYKMPPGKSATVHKVDDSLYDLIIRHRIGNNLIIDYGVKNVELANLLSALSNGPAEEMALPERTRYALVPVAPVAASYRMTIEQTDDASPSRKWVRVEKQCDNMYDNITSRLGDTDCLGLTIAEPHYLCYPNPVPIPDLPDPSDDDDDKDGGGSDDSKVS